MPNDIRFCLGSTATAQRKSQPIDGAAATLCGRETEDVKRSFLVHNLVMGVTGRISSKTQADAGIPDPELPQR